MAIKIQKVGKRIRPKHLYKLRLDFMIGDADHYYSSELDFNPDCKVETYVFEKLTRLFKRAVGYYQSKTYVSVTEIVEGITNSLTVDQKFSQYLIRLWDMKEDEVIDNEVIDEFLRNILNWNSCEHSGDFHSVVGLDYWYVDTDGDKCKISFTGSIKL